MASKTETGSPDPSLPRAAAAWVREVLEPDQLSKAKHRLGLQPLNRRTILLLWGLRVYVLLMVLLVVIQAWKIFHAAK